MASTTPDGMNGPLLDISPLAMTVDNIVAAAANNSATTPNATAEQDPWGEKKASSPSKESVVSSGLMRPPMNGVGVVVAGGKALPGGNTHTTPVAAATPDAQLPNNSQVIVPQQTSQASHQLTTPSVLTNPPGFVPLTPTSSAINGGTSPITYQQQNSSPGTPGKAASISEEGINPAAAPIVGESGEWLCMVCGNVNYKHRWRCHMNVCSAAKGCPGSFTSPPTAKLAQIGAPRLQAWVCPQCNNHNRATRDICHRNGCTTRRVFDSVGTPQFLPGQPTGPPGPPTVPSSVVRTTSFSSVSSANNSVTLTPPMPPLQGVIQNGAMPPQYLQPPSVLSVPVSEFAASGAQPLNAIQIQQMQQQQQQQMQQMFSHPHVQQPLPPQLAFPQQSQMLQQQPNQQQWIPMSQPQLQQHPQLVAPQTVAFDPSKTQLVHQTVPQQVQLSPQGQASMTPPSGVLQPLHAPLQMMRQQQQPNIVHLTPEQMALFAQQQGGALSQK